MNIEGVNPSSEPLRYNVLPVIIGAVNASTQTEHINSVNHNLSVNVATELPTGTNIIGSVKITDGTNILAVDEADTARTTSTIVGAVQGIDSTGKVSPAGDTSTNASWINDSRNYFAIAKGEVPGHAYERQTANAPSFNTADDFVTMWDPADDGNAWEQMNHVYSTTADIDSISSNSIADTQVILINGLDANYDVLNQTAVLNGQNRVAITPVMRINSMINVSNTSHLGHVFAYVNGAITGGVPDTSADIRDLIDPANQVSSSSLFTVPNGKTSYLKRLYVTSIGANKSSIYVVRGIVRLFGGTFLSSGNIGFTDFRNVDFDIPNSLPAKSDLYLEVKANAVGVTGATISGSFDLILVDD